MLEKNCWERFSMIMVPAFCCLGQPSMLSLQALSAATGLSIMEKARTVAVIASKTNKVLKIFCFLILCGYVQFDDG